jgi:hypothetical protein
MDHPNVQPFYGYDDNPAYGPFGALISPVSFISMFIISNVEFNTSGAQKGMPVDF